MSLIPWLAFVSVVACQGRIQGEATFVEKRLAEIPEGMEGTHSLFSPDGQTVAYAGHFPEKSPGSMVVVGGRRSEFYDHAVPLTLGPDQRTIAYVANKGKQWFVVLGAQEGERFDSVGWPVFPPNDDPILIAPDGRSATYFARLGHQMFLVGPMGRGESFDVIHGGLAVNYKTVGYLAQKGEKRFLIAGETKQECEDVDSLSFGPDGKSVAFGIKLNGRWSAIVGGERKGKEFDEAGGPVLSPDGRAFAYWAREGNKKFVVVGDKRGEGFDDIRGIAFAPNSKDVVYVAVKDGKQFIVTGEQKGEAYDSIRVHRFEPWVAFSPDGKTVAYAATQGKRQFIVAGGRKGYDFDEVRTGRPRGWLEFSPDGMNVAYRAREGDREFAVVGENRGEGFDAVWDMVFSSDGKAFAYCVRKDGKEFVVLRDSRSEAFDGVRRPVLSGDGRKLAFGALQGRELWWKVIQVK